MIIRLLLLSLTELLKVFNHPCIVILFFLNLVIRIKGEPVNYINVGTDTFLECDYDVYNYSMDAVRMWIREQNGNTTQITSNDKILVQHSHFRLDEDAVLGIYNLKIVNASVKETSGSFYCAIIEQNVLVVTELIAEAAYNLVVRVPPSPPKITPQYPAVQEGEEVELNCTFTTVMNSTPEISWIDKNLQDIRMYDKSYSTRLVVKWDTKLLDGPVNLLFTSTLKFRAESKHHNMKIFCRVVSQATREFGYLETKTVLNVRYRPVITISPTGYFAIEKGSNLNITCNIHANPKVLTSHWRRRDIFHGQNKVIELFNTTEEDIGMYTCKGGNILGCGTPQNTTINVLYGPVHSHPPVAKVKEGSNFSFSCGVSSNPTAQTFWMKHDNPDFLVNGTELKFKSVTKQDASIYYCESQNILRLSILGSNSDNVKERATRTNFTLIVVDKCGKGVAENQIGNDSSDCGDSVSLFSRLGMTPIICVLCICFLVLMFWFLKKKVLDKNTPAEPSDTDRENKAKFTALRSQLRRYRYRLGHQFRPRKVEPTVVEV